MPSNYLVYDEGCNLCRLFKNFVLGIDAGRHLRPISISIAVKLGLLDGVKPSNHYTSFHLVITDGSVFSAGEAIPVLIGLLLNARWLGGFVSKSRALMDMIDRAYSMLVEVTHKSYCGQFCNGLGKSKPV